jgi:hypothetical protein
MSDCFIERNGRAAREGALGLRSRRRRELDRQIEKTGPASAGVRSGGWEIRPPCLFRLDQSHRHDYPVSPDEL